MAAKEELKQPTGKKAAPARKAGKQTESRGTTWGRRSFFNLAGWSAMLTALGAGALAFLRFMFPRVLFEPPMSFKAGFPEEYPVGEVSTRFKKSHRVWIVRTEEGFYALLANCTHLGCTPGWFKADAKFKCFCHGSGFQMSGVNFEGPAPRPLERLKIALSPDGELLIDKAVRFRHEKGEWKEEDAFLKV